MPSERLDTPVLSYGRYNRANSAVLDLLCLYFDRAQGTLVSELTNSPAIAITACKGILVDPPGLEMKNLLLISPYALVLLQLLRCLAWDATQSDSILQESRWVLPHSRRTYIGHFRHSPQQITSFPPNSLGPGHGISMGPEVEEVSPQSERSPHCSFATQVTAVKTM